MTDESGGAYGDPTHYPFWEAARRHELTIQHCSACGHHQFYARPFCVRCQASSLSWVRARGTGSIYSMTTVHMPVTPELTPPYIVAVVQLDEGPRLLTNIASNDARIGDVVRVAWRDRGDLPPLPIFETLR